MSKIIITNKTKLSDRDVLDMTTFIFKNKISNVSYRQKKYWSYPIDFYIDDYMCLYNETNKGNKTFTFIEDKGGNND